MGGGPILAQILIQKVLKKFKPSQAPSQRTKGPPMGGGAGFDDRLGGGVLTPYKRLGGSGGPPPSTGREDPEENFDVFPL